MILPKCSVFILQNDDVQKYQSLRIWYYIIFTLWIRSDKKIKDVFSFVIFIWFFEKCKIGCCFNMISMAKYTCTVDHGWLNSWLTFFVVFCVTDQIGCLYKLVICYVMSCTTVMCLPKKHANCCSLLMIFNTLCCNCFYSFQQQLTNKTTMVSIKFMFTL